MEDTNTANIPNENTAICEHCGMKVKTDAQFCSSCGKPVKVATAKIFCQTCGTEIETDEMFCPKCGSATSQNKNVEALNNIAAYNQNIVAETPKVTRKHNFLKISLISLGIIIVFALLTYFIIIPEINYQDACDILEKGRYTAAIDAFKSLGDYKDSETKINEAKYAYVNENKDNQNNTTYDYLLDLRQEYYKDSADIYDELYEWKAEVYAWNSTENGKNNNSSISKYKSVYCHFTVSGGTPGESTRVTYEVTLPNGNESDDTFNFDIYDGEDLWWGYENSIYLYPEYGLAGTLKVKFYDDNGNLIGSSSIRITN